MTAYSSKQAADIAGITYRMLDYWDRTGLVSPSLAPANGSGSRRSYSYGDLLELKVVKTLLDAGIKLESVRAAFACLRENLGEDISTAHLVMSGSSAVLVHDGAELIDAVNRTKGQGVLKLLTFEGIQANLDTDLRRRELVPA